MHKSGNKRFEFSRQEYGKKTYLKNKVEFKVPE